MRPETHTLQQAGERCQGVSVFVFSSKGFVHRKCLFWRPLDLFELQVCRAAVCTTATGQASVSTAQCRRVLQQDISAQAACTMTLGNILLLHCVICP